MSLNTLIAQIEELRQQGCLILLKWDGERTTNVTTVVVTHTGLDYVWRKDSDDITATLQQAISGYSAHVRGNGTND